MFKNIFKKSARLGKYNRGVSLVELLVVIAIFMIISSMTIFSYSDFRSSISIQNLADDIALSVRKAQNYAIGAVGSSGDFTYGYGINFSVNSNGRSDVKNKEAKGIPISNNDSKVSSNSKSFIIYIDRDDSGFYNCGSINDTKCLEYLEILSIKSNDYISGIKLHFDTKTQNLRENEQIDLRFKRPNPEPVFCYRRDNDVKCDDHISSQISNIEITISSEKDATIYKKITISNNGQISSDF